jgi:predicted transposase YbfD/YdcC
MLTTNHTDTFIENFSQLEDPRIERHKLYPLIEIVFLVVCAKICGAESFREYVRFGQAKITLLQERLPFVKGIPSKARLSRVFTLINPELLKGCFIGWMKTLYVSVMDDIIPIDGKTLRGSHQSGEGAIHMVSAYSHKTHLVLGQQKVDEKSNEITAIPKLIDLIDIKGSTITIDAMGTQKTIAKKIIDNEADYILALKDNHKNLNEDVQLYLDTEYDKPNQGNLLSHSESDKGHGRIEERTCFVTDKIDWLVDKDEWKGLNAIAMIESKRTLKGRTSIERRYYLTSRDADPEYLNMAIRSHWSIENKLHWVLDVTMGEDGSRVRKDHAPENLAIVRHISLNMLQEAKKSIKDMSIKGFRKMAGWCDKTLGKIIRSKF